jgi:hypothetical protein
MTGKNLKCFEKALVLVPLCPPQIPHAYSRHPSTYCQDFPFPRMQLAFKETGNKLSNVKFRIKLCQNYATAEKYAPKPLWQQIPYGLAWD